MAVTQGKRSDTTAKELGININVVYQVLADRARQLKPSPEFYRHTAHRVSEERRQKFLEVLAATGDLRLACREAGVSSSGITARWLRPPDRKAQAVVMLSETPAKEAVLENVLAALHRDDQLDATMHEHRQALAVKLYDAAGIFWDRARTKAEQEPVPAGELKALVSAGHYAIHDAQLLGGQPTERYESAIQQIGSMSDEELRAFVFGGDSMLYRNSSPQVQELRREVLGDGAGS